MTGCNPKNQNRRRIDSRAFRDETILQPATLWHGFRRPGGRNVPLRYATRMIVMVRNSYRNGRAGLRHDPFSPNRK